MKVHTLLLAAVVFATSLQAQTFTIDPTHSTIGFEVRHFFSKVSGRFNKFEGKITFDPKDPTSSTVSATIDAASIDTANDNRDEHLRGPDFFDTEKFGDITFASKSLKTTGATEGEITGDLTMHGVTKEVSLKVKLLGQAKGMKGETRSSWEAATTINRKDFGIVWSNVIEGVAVVGDEVDIKMAIEAVQE